MFEPQVGVGVPFGQQRLVEHGAVVKVRFESGREIEKFVPLAKGKPARWMSRDDLYGKFSDCAAPVLGEAGARKVFELLQGLPELPSITPVIAELVRATGRAAA